MFATILYRIKLPFLILPKKYLQNTIPRYCFTSSAKISFKNHTYSSIFTRKFLAYFILKIPPNRLLAKRFPFTIPHSCISSFLLKTPTASAKSTNSFTFLHYLHTLLLLFQILLPGYFPHISLPHCPVGHQSIYKTKHIPVRKYFVTKNLICFHGVHSLSYTLHTLTQIPFHFDCNPTENRTCLLDISQLR